MGVTSEILGNEAKKHQIEHNSKVYKFRLIDQSVQSEWEKKQYQKDCAALKVQRDDDLISAEEYGIELARLRAAFRDGDYEMMSPSGLKLLSSMSGVRTLLTLLVQCPQDEVLQLLMARKAEVVEMVRLLIAESFPGVQMSTTGTEGKPGDAPASAASAPATEGAGSPN